MFSLFIYLWFLVVFPLFLFIFIHFLFIFYLLKIYSYPCYVGNFLYPSITLSLYIILNFLMELHNFNSLSSLFHRFTPLTDKLLSFIFILANFLLKIAVPLSSYFVSRGSNSSCMVVGSDLL